MPSLQDALHCRRPRVLMGLLFFPRGGSAQVVRSLARTLPSQGWEVTVVSGSLQLPGHPGDAHAFFAGLDLCAVDYTAALHAADPLCADPPFHPSYEDRPGAPDRVFARVDEATYTHLVSAWARILRKAGAAEADLLHLHHLTPLHEAARCVAPAVPVVGHLHGTELLLLEAIKEGPPAYWSFAAAWAERMRRWAASCQCLVISSAAQAARAQRVLPIESSRFLVLPNGVDPTRFDRRPVDRRALWQRLLVDHPQGWAPGRAPGSVAYTSEQMRPLAEGPVLLFVGRFTAIKRTRVLIAAYQRAQPAFVTPAPLVLVGGFPGEWEGEHPHDTIQRLGVDQVFLAGWNEHEALPDIYAASDVVILPSVGEQFGQVLVEGMACGLPAIAVGCDGPAEIVEDGQTGWLVPPDDEQALAAALVSAVNDTPERTRRGRAAYAAARARYSWPSLGTHLARTYDALLAALYPG
jgi:glycosyltransferase involved in cell wall biosynthesis